MKKLLALTLVLVLALAMPAMAALKMLPEPLALELEEVAKDHLAAERKISADSITVSEAWVRELWNIEKEIYIVVLLVGDDKISVHVDVAEKAALSDDDFAALVAEDLANEPEEPVFRTMAIGIDTDDAEVGATEAEEQTSKLPYIIGAVAVGLGAGALVLKGRFS